LSHKKVFVTGIFSTHIPYIAFGLFYVFLMIADTSETTVRENKTDSECTGLYSCYCYETPSCQQHAAFACCAGILNADATSRPGAPVFRQKIKYPDFKSLKIPNGHFSYSLLNRPPPAV
jgi:hypothetical protein